MRMMGDILSGLWWPPRPRMHAAKYHSKLCLACWDELRSTSTPTGAIVLQVHQSEAVLTHGLGPDGMAGEGRRGESV